MTRYLQGAEQQVSPSNLTKYCSCHAKRLACWILVTYETYLQLGGATGATLQPHQILRLPRKKTPMLNPRRIWSVIYNARGNRCVSASNLTKYCACHKTWQCKISAKMSENRWNVIYKMRGRSEHDPTMIRAWNRQSATRLGTEVTFRDVRACRAPTISFKNSPSAAPAKKSRTWTSRNTAPATKSDAWTSLNPAPATKTDTWTSPNVARVTKSGTWTSPNAAPATESGTWTSPNAAPSRKSDTWTSPNAAPATKSHTWTSPSAARARKSDTWTSPNAAPATRSDTWTSPNAAPATKSHTWTSPSAARATKSNTWTSPNAAPATRSDTWTSPKAAPGTETVTWRIYCFTNLAIPSRIFLLNESITWRIYYLTIRMSFVYRKFLI